MVYFTLVPQLYSAEEHTMQLLAYALFQTEYARDLQNGLRMVQNENGKPYFPDFPDLHFSISHTKGAIAVAIATQEVGVDCVRIRQFSKAFLDRVFDPIEWISIARNTDEPALATALASYKKSVLNRDGVGITTLGAFCAAKTARRFSCRRFGNFVVTATTHKPAGFTEVPFATLFDISCRYC